MTVTSKFYSALGARFSDELLQNPWFLGTCSAVIFTMGIAWLALRFLPNLYVDRLPILPSPVVHGVSGFALMGLASIAFGFTTLHLAIYQKPDDPFPIVPLSITGLFVFLYFTLWWFGFPRFMAVPSARAELERRNEWARGPFRRWHKDYSD